MVICSDWPTIPECNIFGYTIDERAAEDGVESRVTQSRVELNIEQSRVELRIANSELCELSELSRRELKRASLASERSIVRESENNKEWAAPNRSEFLLCLLLLLCLFHTINMFLLYAYMHALQIHIYILYNINILIAQIKVIGVRINFLLRWSRAFYDFIDSKLEKSSFCTSSSRSSRMTIKID